MSIDQWVCELRRHKAHIMVLLLLLCSALSGCETGNGGDNGDFVIGSNGSGLTASGINSDALGNLGGASGGPAGINVGPGTGVPFVFTTGASDSLTVSPSSTSIPVNGTQQLQVSVVLSNGTIVSSNTTSGTLVFTSKEPSVATVSDTGLVRGVSVGNTTVTVTLTVNGVTLSQTVAVEVTALTPVFNVTETSVTLTNATSSVVITASFSPNNTTASQNVTSQTTGVLTDFTGGVDNSNLSYNAGTVASSVPVNGTATLTVNFSSGGVLFSDTVAVTVSRAAPIDPNAVVSAQVVSVRGSTLRLPVGFGYPLVVRETQADGTVRSTPGSFGTAPGEYQAAVSGGLASVNTLSSPTMGHAFVTTSAVGSGTINITRNNSIDGGLSTLAPLTLDVIGVDLKPGTTTPPPPTFNVTFAFSGPNSGPPGTVVPYTVTLQYADNTTQDITPLWQVNTQPGSVIDDTTTQRATTIFDAGPDFRIYAGNVVVQATGSIDPGGMGLGTTIPGGPQYGLIHGPVPFEPDTNSFFVDRTP